MSKNQERIKKLSENLEILAKRQDAFGRAIRQLREEIRLLKGLEEEQFDETEQFIERPSEQEIHTEGTAKEYRIPSLEKTLERIQEPRPSTSFFPEIKSNLEKFIGESLISKLGILVLLIGVGIGVKYSIENELVSPLTRIILGYLVSFGLLGFAVFLKPNYEKFSAALLSGAMASLYFITYAAYSFYGLFPQGLTFVLMALFTVFTVVAALNYDKQVIALIGLVGAYAVPFLLSSGSGRVGILFTYVAIINIGILIIGVKKYWKLLFYSAFVMTWLIFGSWMGTEYSMDEYFGFAFSFLFIFFIIFYATFLANKLVNKEKFGLSDIVLLMLNSFLFFGIGLGMLNEHEVGEQLLGVFALGNAILHFFVSFVIYQRNLADRSLQYLTSGLVLVFITIAIPIQLDGNWVTLLWAGEAALLFWIGRSKNIPIYEKLSYPLMILAFGSLLQDWALNYNHYNLSYHPEKITPLFNIHFLTSLIFVGLFVFINWVNRNDNYNRPSPSRKSIAQVFSYLIPGILLFTIYYAFAIEIENYWHQLYIDSEISQTNEYATGEYLDTFNNRNLKHFQSIWLINYSLLFLTILSVLNIKKFKNEQLGVLNLLLNILGIGAFLSQGLYLFSELRESYLSQEMAEFYHIGGFHIGARYMSFLFVAALLFVCYQYTRQAFMKADLRKYFDLLLHVSLVWIISSELIHWLDMAGSPENYKLGLSILWGSYSLLLIVLGIWKKKKHLRLGAMALFGLTLAKLFLYDISHLNTISKTIVFVSLGILLLIISFLYNKYKHDIFDEEE